MLDRCSCTPRKIIQTDLVLTVQMQVRMTVVVVVVVVVVVLLKHRVQQFVPLVAIGLTNLPPKQHQIGFEIGFAVVATKTAETVRKASAAV